MDDVEEYRDAFSLFDRKGDGKIESGQIGSVLRALGLNPTQADVKKVEKDVDPEGSKRISFEEFLPVYYSQKQKKPMGSIEHFNEGLRVFDRDGNGFISAAEIRHVLSSLGERLTNDECEVLLQGMEDNQGQVNYEDFVRNVMNG